MDFAHIMNHLGVKDTETIVYVHDFFQLVVMGLVGWLTYVIISRFISTLFIRIAKRTATIWDDKIMTPAFFKNMGVFFAPILIRIVSSLIGWEYDKFVYNILDVWTTLGVMLILISLLDGVNRIYNSYSISRERPITVFIQVIKIILWCAAVIIIISILIEKNPKTLLLSLGAFAAVLMLIFQNTLLGLVAGIQLSANNMLRIGDWIEMPSSRADGEVQEINLTTVKVQNWDMTITTIPTYKLVSESFTNWRGMQESAGRRIKRAILIDIHSIRYLDEKDFEKLKDSTLLGEYIKKKIDEVEKFNGKQHNSLDKRRLTNIGTFREYLESWIDSNPDINKSMTHMVRQLEPGPTGVPLEIYCFSAIKEWVEYERVQSDLFDHFFAVMDLFELKAFEYSAAAVVS
ncbi:MAG: mechanosensitive ion channel family protein [Culturomica sp.]|jgi:miniconductance mechanosensitive channel|nr:mechanosensitive ion channel family protein [Culturomica sp.]